MPITYETPSPIAINNRFATGNGSGPGGSMAEMYAAEVAAKQQSAAQQAQLMQQDRFHADAFREGQQEFAASRDWSPRDAGAAEAATAQQNLRLQNQIQLNQAELSQADNMRLQRLKQGEDAIKQQVSEGSLTQDEAAAMSAQLRTGINPLEVRKAKAQITHQDMQNQALQAHMKLELQRSESLGKQEEARLAFATAQAEGKVKYIPNAAAAAALKAQWADDFVGQPPEALEKAVNDELMRTGQYKTHYIAKDGTLVEAKIQDHMPGAEGEGHGGSSGSHGSSGSRPTRESTFDASRAYHDAESAVDKLVTDGAIKREDAEAEINRRFEARKAAFAGYAGEKEQQKTAGQPKPFDYRNPQSGSPLQQQKIMELDAARRNLPPNIPPLVQAQVSKAIDEGMRLVSKYSDETGAVKNPPKHVKDRLEQISRLVADVKAGKFNVPNNSQPNGSFTPEQRAILDRISKTQPEQQAPPGNPNAPVAAAAAQVGRDAIPPGTNYDPRAGAAAGAAIQTGRAMIPSVNDVGRALVPAVGIGEALSPAARQAAEKYLENLKRQYFGK